MTSNDERPPVGYGVMPPGFRLPPGTTVGAVRLRIADLERSIGYYRSIIGLVALERSAEAATLGVKGTNLPLVHLEASANAKPVPRRGRFGLYHFAILFPDRATLGRFAAHLSRAQVR